MKTTLTGAFVLVVVVAGCAGAPQAGASPSSPAALETSAVSVPTAGSGEEFVLLDFEGTDAFLPTAEGSEVEVDDQREGMAVGRVTSGDGSRGLRFPHYADAPDAPRMVLVVKALDVSKASADSTAVHGGLRFGADLKLDMDASRGPFDNGDNVVQRGLFADASQYKLQVDKRVPSCTVRSPEASAFVKLPAPMERGWYRVGCEYKDAVLTVSASPMHEGALGQTVQASVTREVGPLAFKPSTPVAIGGKIGSSGLLVHNQPDQFNGALDNVFVAHGSSGSR